MGKCDIRLTFQPNAHGRLMHTLANVPNVENIVAASWSISLPSPRPKSVGALLGRILRQLHLLAHSRSFLPLPKVAEAFAPNVVPRSAGVQTTCPRSLRS